MAVRKLRGSWWTDITWKSVRLRRRSPLNTKVGAEAFEVTLRQALTRAGTVDAFLEAEKEEAAARERTAVTFAAFAERWMREYVAVNNKPSEQNNKRLMLGRHLLPRFGREPLGSLSTASIEAYKAEKRASGLGPKTINNHLALLGRCLRTAQEWGALDRLPRVKLLKTPPPAFRYLKPEEFARLRTAASPGLWRSMIVTAARTGLRFSELAALQWDDIDAHRAVLVVRRANVRGWCGTPKSNRTRVVPLVPEVLAELGTLPREGSLVFSWNGRWVRHEFARRHLLAACKTAGIEPIGWHDLRHTFASHLAQAGAPITAVKELLGHSSLAMTMRYSHLDESTLRRAVMLLDTSSDFRATCRQPEIRDGLPTSVSVALQGSNLPSTQQKTPALASVS
jgi:integrase